MIYSVGIDAASIERCMNLDKHFISKVFHPKEIKEYEKLIKANTEVKAQFLASRFAVKEAYAKARGLGFCSDIIPKEICTCEDENGKPFIKLDGRTEENHPKGIFIHLSLTHQKPLAIAVVILETRDEKP